MTDWDGSTSAAGPTFQEFAVATFERCERIVGLQLAAQAAVALGQNSPLEPAREFIICSLDLISGLAEGIGPSIETLVARSQLRSLLLQCCQVRAVYAARFVTQWLCPGDGC